MVFTENGLNMVRDWLAGSDVNPPKYTALGTVTFRVTVDDFGSANPVSDWINRPTTNALAPTVDTTYYKEGHQSIKLSVDVDATGTTAEWYSTVAKTNLSRHQHGDHYLWVRFTGTALSQASTGTVLSIWFGNGTVISGKPSASNYIRFDLKNVGLESGWNKWNVDFDNPDGSYGTMSWGTVDYRQIRVYQKDGATSDFHINLDWSHVYHEADESDTGIFSPVGTTGNYDFDSTQRSDKEWIAETVIGKTEVVGKSITEVGMITMTGGTLYTHHTFSEILKDGTISLDIVHDILLV